MSHDLTQIRAILGPTNTGKTHIAMERLLAHPSGMIGFPLRLLARENYDRLMRGDFGKVHSADIALITGEEKIVPPNARYFICTVEAMPVSRPVDFLAIDEIQLATDAERGYVFTERLLHARGAYETLFLGSDTMANILSSLVPEARIETRSRFSALRWDGMKKLSRLPRRSAITAFSVENVYALAEVLRQQKGGAAVVMGALSPRTRNAQVELYQSGEVDYLVATDAIGMGLNMDIDHVAFAQIRKFDGRTHRQLSAAEFAQIAGRAGRYRRDGTFGLTGEAAALDEELIGRIENHEFEPIKSLMWRNRDLDFTSIDHLIVSLEASAPRAGLMRAPPSDDMMALIALRQNPDIRDRAHHIDLVRLLWDVAQIPDFRKTLGGDHAGLIHDVFLFLTGTTAHIAPDWLATRIARCDNDEGDLDTLATRLAHIRTWNYVAHKSDWLADARHWQERGRAVEERLSDALHVRLTKQFVDRKSSSFLKKLNEQEDVTANIEDNGDITIGDEYAGRVIGLTLQRDPRLKSAAIGIARRAVEQRAGMTIRERAQRIGLDSDAAFMIDHAGDIIWENATLARVQFDMIENKWMGTPILAPRIRLIADDMLNGELRKNVELRLQNWARQYAENRLAPLRRLEDTADMDGLARGLAFRLYEAHGSLARSEIRDLLADLDQPARAQLRKYGVRFGSFNVYLTDLLKPAAAQYIALSASLSLGRDARADHHKLPRAGLTSVARDPDIPHLLYRAAGFHPFKRRVVRFDMLERLADLIREAQRGQKAFTISEPMLSIMGCGHDDMGHILRALGYQGSPRSQIAETHRPDTGPDTGPQKGSDTGSDTDPEKNKETPLPPENASSELASGEIAEATPPASSQAAEPTEAPSETALEKDHNTPSPAIDASVSPATEPNETPSGLLYWSYNSHPARKRGDRSASKSRSKAGRPQNQGERSHNRQSRPPAQGTALSHTSSRSSSHDPAHNPTHETAHKLSDTPGAGPKKPNKRRAKNQPPHGQTARGGKPNKPRKAIDPDNPFAALADLKIDRK